MEATVTDRLSSLYRLCLVTGLRRGEGMALRWSSIDLDRGLLAITEQVTEVNGRAVTGKPKTRRSVRTVAIDETMTQILRDHRKLQAEERAAGASCRTLTDSPSPARTAAPYDRSTSLETSRPSRPLRGSR